MIEEISNYHQKLDKNDKLIVDFLYNIISKNLDNSENKIWHAHPVWFIDGNPIVGYSKQKKGIRLMFWSGADFSEIQLNVLGKKFKDASIFYNDISEINENDLLIWLEKAIKIQWDYKNIVKRKGNLIKLTSF